MQTCGYSNRKQKRKKHRTALPTVWRKKRNRKEQTIELYEDISHGPLSLKKKRARISGENNIEDTVRVLIIKK